MPEGHERIGYRRTASRHETRRQKAGCGAGLQIEEDGLRWRRTGAAGPRARRPRKADGSVENRPSRCCIGANSGGAFLSGGARRFAIEADSSHYGASGRFAGCLAIPVGFFGLRENFTSNVLRMNVKHWNEKQVQDRRRSTMPPTDGRSDGVTAMLPRLSRKYNGPTRENEGNRGHQNRPESAARRLQWRRGVNRWSDLGREAARRTRQSELSSSPRAR